MPTKLLLSLMLLSHQIIILADLPKREFIKVEKISTTNGAAICATHHALYPTKIVKNILTKSLTNGLLKEEVIGDHASSFNSYDNEFIIARLLDEIESFEKKAKNKTVIIKLPVKRRVSHECSCSLQ